MDPFFEANLSFCWTNRNQWSTNSEIRNDVFKIIQGFFLNSIHQTIEKCIV